MQPEEEHKRFEFTYGIIMFRTQRFRNLMDRLGRRRISRPLGWLLLYIMPVAAAIGLYVFLLNFSIFFSPVVHSAGAAVRSVSPLAYLGLPGINPYIPVFYGWAALIVAMVIHEGAHGIIARSLGYPVKSSGLLFFLVIPIGAFVEVDETALKAGRPRDAGRILAAGAGVNFVVGLIFLLLMFNVVSTMSPAANGLAITQVTTNINVNGTNIQTTAGAAGIQPGDFIMTANGVQISESSQIANAPWYHPGQRVNFTLYRGGSIIQSPEVTVGTNPNNSTLGYVGIETIGLSNLKGIVSDYTGAFFTKPFTYFCIPSFPRCQDIAPFSDHLGGFYTSSYGPWLIPLANLFYWFFFLNFNLAIFNAMPIYPLDGGQAFDAGLKGITKGRLSDKARMRILTAVTLVVLFMVASLPLAAYLNLI